jgi:hypothetical protein
VAQAQGIVIGINRQDAKSAKMEYVLDRLGFLAVE